MDTKDVAAPFQAIHDLNVYEKVSIRAAQLSEVIRLDRLSIARFTGFAVSGAVVNLGVLPQSPAGLTAAARLQPPEKPGLPARRVPEFPRDHARAVPGRILIGPGIP